MDNGDNRIVLFGAGGHAKSVIAVLHAQGKWRVAALLEDAADEPAKAVLGHAVLGDRSRLAELRQAGVDKGFVAIGDNRARCELARVLLETGFSLISVIHPAAVCLLDASIGAGSFVHALAVIGPECRIGRTMPSCSRLPRWGTRAGLAMVSICLPASMSAAKFGSATTASSGLAPCSFQELP